MIERKSLAIVFICIICGFALMGGAAYAGYVFGWYQGVFHEGIMSEARYAIELKGIWDRIEKVEKASAKEELREELRRQTEQTLEMIRVWKGSVLDKNRRQSLDVFEKYTEEFLSSLDETQNPKVLQEGN